LKGSTIRKKGKTIYEYAFREGGGGGWRETSRDRQTIMFMKAHLLHNNSEM